VGIRNRFWHYASKVMQGYVRPRQLVNLTLERITQKTEVISWQPSTLSVFVTSLCNFRCDMCPTHSKRIPDSYVHCHREETDMSPDLLSFALDSYPTVIRVPLIGVGEPLLNPHFFDLVKECVKRRKIVNTVSNGKALGAYIHDIVHSGLDRVCVSVNGHTAEEFHRMTGNPEANFSRILHNIEALVRARGKNNAPRIDLSFIIDRHNYHYMKDMLEIAENLGADFVYLLHFLASPYPGFTPEERCLYEDDQAVKDELFRLMSKKYRCEVEWPYLLKRPGGERIVCKWPFSLIQIDGGGYVGGCPVQLSNMHNNGTIYDKDVWNNQYFRDLRRRHLQGNLFGPCESCVCSVGINPAAVVKF